MLKLNSSAPSSPNAERLAEFLYALE